MRAARYGHVSPDVYEMLDWDLGLELARRATKQHHDDLKFVVEIATQFTTAIVKSNGARII